MVVSRLSFGLFDRDSIAIEIEPQLNNQQRTSMLVSVDFHGVQSQHVMSRSSIRFEWSSWRRLTTTFRIAWISITLFIKHDNKLNSNSKSNAMPQSRPAQQESSVPTIALALGFDNQTRSSIQFEWNGRLGVEFDHGQGVAQPSLCQMKDMKDAMA